MKMAYTVALLLSLLCWSWGKPVWSAADNLSLAQKEKKVVIYHTTTAPDTAAIAAEFKKKYPFAEVEVIAAPARNCCSASRRN